MYLNIGLVKDDKNKIQIRIDTSATVNTLNKAYHQSVMSQSPSGVAEYFKYDPDTEYNILQLLTALDLKGTHQLVENGSITAVIRYKGHYLINKTSVLILSFALGNNVALLNIYSNGFH